jgi:hypothetical protein
MDGWMDGWLCFVRMDPKFTFLKLDVTLPNSLIQKKKKKHFLTDKWKKNI